MGQISQGIESGADQGRQEKRKFEVVEREEGAEQAYQDKEAAEAEELESECDTDAQNE